MVRRRRPKELEVQSNDLMSIDSGNDDDIELLNLSKVNVDLDNTQVIEGSDRSSKPNSSSSSGTVLVNWVDGCVEDTLLHLSPDSDKCFVSPPPELDFRRPDSDDRGETHWQANNDLTIPVKSNQRNVPRFTQNDRSDILTFIIEENERLKAKSELLNGWFKKITTKAKQSVLKQTSRWSSGDVDQEEEPDDDDEDDQWEQVQCLNPSNSNQKSQELSLLISPSESPLFPVRKQSHWFVQILRRLSGSKRRRDDLDQFVTSNILKQKSRFDSDCDPDPDDARSYNDDMFMQLTELHSRSSDDELSYASRSAAASDLLLPQSKCLLNFSSDSHPNGLSFKHKKKTNRCEQSESRLAILLQVFFPFFIAGFGTVGAGLVLDYVQHWDVFQRITEVFILVPALLGLKGNLEMTLASRLSTQANLGRLDSFKTQWKMASGNMALIQCQSTVVGFLAALFAIAVNWLPDAEFHLDHALILCAASLLTACLASLLLGIVMIVVVIVSHKCSINPDNVATPIAASLGDLITLAILAQISSYLYQCIDGYKWVYVLAIALPFLTIPLWCVIAHHNEYTNEVLYSGWTPVITAMAISSVGGCILDFAVSRFKGIAVFQPVINGVGGNLAAVQASRISTYLHQNYKLGQLSSSERIMCLAPTATFFSKSEHSKTAQVLMLLVIPGHLVFTYGIRLLQAGHTSMTIVFLCFYLAAACVQVFILLYLAQIIIFWMWRLKVDPDNSAIPYLTALGDLIGTGLLALAFYTLYIIGDKDTDVGD